MYAVSYANLSPYVLFVRYKLTAERANTSVKPTTHTTLIRFPNKNNRLTTVATVEAAVKLSAGGLLRKSVITSITNSPRRNK